MNAIETCMNCNNQASDAPSCGRVFNSLNRKLEIVKKLTMLIVTRAGTAPLSRKKDDHETVTLHCTKSKLE